MSDSDSHPGSEAPLVGMLAVPPRSLKTSRIHAPTVLSVRGHHSGNVTDLLPSVEVFSGCGSAGWVRRAGGVTHAESVALGVLSLVLFLSLGRAAKPEAPHAASVYRGQRNRENVVMFFHGVLGSPGILVARGRTRRAGRLI